MKAQVGKRLAPIREVLANGTTVLAKESRTTPAVTIVAALQAGSIHDSDQTPGLAYFLSRVIDRGTGRRSVDEIAEVLDLRGVSLAVNVTRHALTLSCNCLSEDFEAIMALLGDIVRDPGCPDVEVDTRRGEILTSIRQDDDNPAVKAVERLMTSLYGETHAYGRPPKGTAATVERIDRRALIDFHQARVAPSALSMAVVGDVSAGAAVEAVSCVFGDWQATPRPAASLAPTDQAVTRRRTVLPMMNKSQADIAYGFTTIRRVDPAYHAYWLMTNILGQYGMGGRLGQSIRERQGMAYYAFSVFEANVIAGPLIVRAGVNGANVDRAVASIDEEVSRMAADGVTNAELDDSKRYLIGSIPRTLETNEGIAAFLQSVQQFDLGLDYDRRLPDLLNAVTRDEVHEAARRTLVPERASVVIAGPYEGKDEGAGS